MCLFTNGWDIYNPFNNFIFHYYKDPRREANKLHTVPELRKKSLKRLFFLLKLNESIPLDDESLRDIDKYPLGTFRSVDSFWKYSGIDFSDKNNSKRKWCDPSKNHLVSFIHRKDSLEYPKNLEKLPIIE